MAGDGPSPPNGSRTRIYSVVLVIVTISVVTLAVLLPVILNRYPIAPAPPSGGTNVQVDDYASGSTWTGQFGDDPTVAVAPNGTIAIAWEGLDEVAPPSTPGGPPVFTTSIFVSFSGDGGQHYSAPNPVGSSSTVSAFLPSLAFGPNGTLFVAYANATNGYDQEIVVASAAPGQNFTPGIVAEAGQDMGRPWLFVLASGVVVLVFEYNDLVEWAMSVDGGRSFEPPTILLEGLLTGATEWGADEVTLVGLSVGALTFTTVGIWSATFNATGAGVSQMGTAATIAIPYPYSVDAPELARPGPTVTFAGGLLYLLYASANESKLALQTSNTNGTTWAGPWTLWSGRNTSIETPEAQAAPGGTMLALSWASTQGGFWNTYAALYNVRTGLLSAPDTVSSLDGFPASVRNWHGTTMGLAIAGSTQFVVVWGDGRGLGGIYGLTHVYACTLTASL
ncbi:MAG: hypothetical protein WA688_04140 [Thermoplasmata archaeon]